MFLRTPYADGAVGSIVARIMCLLEEWDLTMVKAYLVQKGIYTADEIDAVEREYKRFLALTIAYGSTGRRIPMCQKADDLWHGHILFTEDYHAMCAALGVEYIHHRPCILDGGPEMLKADYEQNTRPLYEQHFGSIPEHIWQIGGQICVKCCFTKP